MSTRNDAIDEAVSLINGLDWGTGDRWRAMSEAKCAVMDLRSDDEPAVKVDVIETIKEPDGVGGDNFMHSVVVATDAGTLKATMLDSGEHMSGSRFSPSEQCWHAIGEAVREAESKFK